MRLLLDIGNTRIKWTVQTERGLDPQQVIAHAGVSTAQLITQVFAPCGQVAQVLVSNVAGAALAEQVREAARDCWQLEPRFIVAPASMSLAHGVLRNAYAQPAKLGVDRWLGMLAAYTQQPTPTLVVSIGTALTVDAITGAGQHLGGLIVPGPDLMLRSLMRHTSDIAARATPVQGDATFFADNTLSCVQQGTLHAAVALIESAHARLRAHSGVARLLLTGGAAAPVRAQLAANAELIPELVLQGLATL